MKIRYPLAVRLYVIGLLQLVFMLAPAILYSGPPPFGLRPPPERGPPPGWEHGLFGGPPTPLGIAPPLLNFLCGFVVIAVGSWVTAWWIGRPLRRLADGAQRIADGDLRVRVAFDRNDEFGRVGAAFDEMAARVEGLVRAEKELLANVSHELRTSLARIRVAVTLAAEGDHATSRAALAEIGTDVGELSVLLDGVFETARVAVDGDATAAPTTLALAREALAPSAIVERAVERFRAHHPKRQVSIDIDVGEAIVVADAALATRALGNLLDNADKYSRGAIAVRVRAEDEDVRYEVADEGIGIAASELGRIFEPFYRATSARKLPGVGIGLALVKRIVTSHEGRVTIASTLGKGTTVTMWLPRA